MPKTATAPPNPLAALQQLNQPLAQSEASGIGQYVTAAMLAAASGQCGCETCRLMARAAVLMRRSLPVEDNDG
jgi:hypothetical protein